MPYILGTFTVPAVNRIAPIYKLYTSFGACIIGRILYFLTIFTPPSHTMGIISIGDLAVRGDRDLACEALGKVSVAA